MQGEQSGNNVLGMCVCGGVPGLLACAVSQGIRQLKAAPEDWVYVCEEGNTQ